MHWEEHRFLTQIPGLEKDYNKISTISKSRESFIVSLVLFYLMVIILLPICKSTSLIQQSSSMLGDLITGILIL